jgi:predicted transcriptional regulator|nr:MucR family transcriptional regulator [Neorhizobium tomejilense]
MDTNQSPSVASDDILIQLTSDIVSAYVGNHNVPSQEIPNLIRDTFAALSAPKGEAKQVEDKPVPAVPVNKSIDKNGEYIICLEDGKKFKSMKRHLSSVYNMTPDEYRQRWGLSADYPMVARAYAEKRSKLAKDMGLGRSARVA